FTVPYTHLPRHPPSFPTRRSSDLSRSRTSSTAAATRSASRSISEDAHDDQPNPDPRLPAWLRHRRAGPGTRGLRGRPGTAIGRRSEEHTSELQSREKLVCRLLLEK